MRKKDIISTVIAVTLIFILNFLSSLYFYFDNSVVIGILFLGGIAVSAYIILVILPKIFSLNNKKNFSTIKSKYKFPKDDEIHYFREIPNNFDLKYIYWLTTYFKISENRSNIISAYLLKWLDENKIKKIVNDDKTIMFDFSIPFKADDIDENDLKEMLLKACINYNFMLDKNNIVKYFKENGKELQNWFKNLNRNIENKMLKDNLIEDRGKYEKYITKKVYDDALQLAGLKKYLLEYSLIKNRDNFEIALWNKYLKYALMLGIAHKLSKELGQIDPNYLEYVDYNFLYVENMFNSFGENSNRERYNKEEIEYYEYR